jgi:hypothetical protein
VRSKKDQIALVTSPLPFSMALHFQFNPAKEGWNSRPALVLTVSLQGDREASGGNRLDVDRDQAKGTLV